MYVVLETDNSSLLHTPASKVITYVDNVFQISVQVPESS